MVVDRFGIELEKPDTISSLLLDNNEETSQSGNQGDDDDTEIEETDEKEDTGEDDDGDDYIQIDVDYTEVDSLTNKSNSSQLHHIGNSSARPLKRVVTSDHLYNLKRQLLSYYDVNARPMHDNSKTMRVQLSVSILQINHLDALYQVLHSYVAENSAFYLSQSYFCPSNFFFFYSRNLKGNEMSMKIEKC